MGDQVRPAGDRTDSVFIKAFVISVGSRRFTPAARIQFNEDGVVLALKEFSNVPLLLNVKAMYQCLANLTLGPFPVFLFYLKASCVKQIRIIFSMKEDEYVSKENTESVESYCNLSRKERCIAIYPTMLTSVDIELVVNMFHRMQQKIGRRQNVLKFIDSDSVVNLMYNENLKDETLPPDVVTL